MTELGHGSNVRGLLTTATYDAKTQEFVVNCPGDAASKWWIGNGARTSASSVLLVRSGDTVQCTASSPPCFATWLSKA
jgi:acyl-CoA oxidase